MQQRNSKIIDSIGHLIDGMKMKVLDQSSGDILGPNEEGELCFKLDYLMLGYYKKPEEFKKMIDDEGKRIRKQIILE